MDFSKFKTSDWLMVGGGVAMLILGFLLPWSTVSAFGASSSGDSPFNYFFTGGIAWLLVVAVGVLALLKAIGKLPETQPWGLIFLGGAGLATLLMLLRVILGGRDLGFGVEADRGIGMYGGLVWAAVALAGAFMNFQAGGGQLSDLTDMDKLKDAFDGDDSTPPPPPPPAQ
ncbi:MAG: hypothetical protein ACE37B_09040 [Ilumatobacter sp.]|uniref:hypothetical protein n=1 Tax=Ilumatobacter sp. TaxID=1967498 RepID=UPI00391D8FA0